MENPARRLSGKNLDRTRRLSVWGLALLSLAILFLTREIEAHSLIAALLVLPIALWNESRKPLAKTVWLQNVIVLALFSASVARLFLTETAFLLIVADFLIFFMLLKLIFEKGEDDLMQVIALSFFLLLSASTLALDFSFLIGFVLYILLAAWTLTLHTLAGQMAPPAANGREGAKKSGVNGPEASDVRDLFRFARRNAWITLGLVTAFSVGIFIFFPRLSLAVFQGAFLNPPHESGYADQVNLRKAGTIRERDTLVMRVEIDPERRNELAGDAGYLRGHTLAAFNGQSWSVRPEDKKAEGRKPFIQKIVKNYFPVPGAAQTLLAKEYGLEVSSQSYLRQEIYIESIGHSTLFGLPWIDQIEAKLPQILIGEDGSVRRSEHTKGRFHYSVKSLMARPSEATLIRRARDAAREAASREAGDERAGQDGYLDLPEMDRAALRNLLDQIVNRNDTPYAKARKIERYLSNNYFYNLTIRPVDMEKPVESFLFRDKQGACEYFASAMAVLLRLEGIPSRMVNGFLMREWNPKGNYFVVRAKDAHSWVEADIGGIWVQFDPSPIVRGEEAELTLWQAARQRLEYWNFLWTAHVLGYDMESQKTIARNVELKSTAFSARFERFSERWRRQIWNVRKGRGEHEKGMDQGPGEGKKSPVSITLFLVFSGLLMGAFLIYFYGRKRGWKWGRGGYQNGGPGDFYFELLRLLERRGWAKKSHETPQEFYDRLIREKPEFGTFQGPAGRLQGLFYRVRYGGENLDETARQDIKKAILSLKSDIQQIKR